jgi:translation initiation factor 3 subunit L
MQIFEFLLASPKPDLALNTQWIYDLMLEFIYQYQGFCQYRSQLQSRSTDDLKLLASNSTAWTYPAIWKILTGLIRKSGIMNKSRPQIKPDSSVVLQFGLFASIEQARLECLCGDHLASLRAASYVDPFEHSELFEVVPFGQVNLYYHMGISHLLLRHFTDAIDTFSHVALYISRILKPGMSNLRSTMITTLNKTLDKILALVTIAAALNPGRRIDEQVRELIHGKFKDKAHKLVEGDTKAFLDLFESASPKFIVMGVPDYSNPPTNLNQENFSRQVQTFMREVGQNVSILKLRSYLRLYAAIEVSKLARFNVS